MKEEIESQDGLALHQQIVPQSDAEEQQTAGDLGLAVLAQESIERHPEGKEEEILELVRG